MRRLAMMMTCSCFLGCSVASWRVPVATLKAPYKLEVTKAGEPTREVVLAPGSEDEREVVRWLAAHESGWKLDLNTYAPGRRIRGEMFDLNFYTTACVLNYGKPGEDRIEVSRKIDPDDVPAFLRNRP